MPTKKLTKRAVDEALPKAKYYVLWDTELKGFGLKVLPTGRKRFYYQYRNGGRGTKPQQADIGYFGSPWTVETARKQAERFAFERAHGGDPARAKRSGRAAAVELAFDAYAEFFIEQYLPAHWPRNKAEGGRLLRREAIPHFRSTPLSAIRKRDVTALFDKLQAKPGIAKNTAAVLRKLFNWAVSRGDVDVSPMAGIALPKGPGERRRHLKDAELAKVWQAAETLGNAYGRLVQALILTGQRRDEVAGMRFSELNLEAGIWTIPAERMKLVQVEREHVVHLTPRLLSVIESEGRGMSDFVFTTSGRRSIQNWSYWKRRLDAVLADSGEAMEEWTLHDLRRSVASGLQRLGVDQEVIEALQSRRPVKGNAGRYQRHDFLDERKLATVRWAAHVAALTSPPHLAAAA